MRNNLDEMVDVSEAINSGGIFYPNKHKWGVSVVKSDFVMIRIGGRLAKIIRWWRARKRTQEETENG